MARTNRRDVLTDSDIQVVHCINRCVRRAFLCGRDPLTGKDFEARRHWIRQRLEFLAGVMGVEVLGYAVMSNHLHCVLRNRPDVVQTWSDDQAAQKWWQLCPARRNKDGSPAEPTELELNAIRNDKKGLKEKRQRLSSVSWFMRFLSERIARQANREEECTGRFWEGRFKAQVLLDEAALLACLQYVDLNPIRAGIARSLEASSFTSAQDRLLDLKAAERPGDSSSSGVSESSTVSPEAEEKGRNAAAMDQRIEHGPRAGWLAPIPEAPKRKAVRQKTTGRRASNRGCLPLGLGEYLQLLDWTGRQIRTGKRGSIPENLEPLFERLEISQELWVDCVMNFRRWFRSSVGRPKSMESAASARGQNRAISIRASRQAFA